MDENSPRSPKSIFPECPSGQLTMSSAAYAPASQTEDEPASSSSNAHDTQLTPESDLDSDFEVDDEGDRLRYSLELPKPRRDIRKHEGSSKLLSRHDGTLDEPTAESEGKRLRQSQRSGTFSKTWTVEEEKTVVKKFDRRLVLFMALLYMLSFLDRSSESALCLRFSIRLAKYQAHLYPDERTDDNTDIGNAEIAGLKEDLHLTSDQFEWLLTAFYITYIVFEWMTLMYKIVPPHIYISLCVLSWGILASMQSLVTSFGMLIVLRALLGIGEAAFGPGVPFYLSFFYKRSELAFRTGLFISAAPLSISFASTLSYVIVRIFSGGPLASWRALFLVEGFPSVLVAVFAWFFIPDSPSSATYLTPRERKVATLRLEGAEPSSALTVSSHRLNWREIAGTLADPKAYLTAMMFFSCNVAFSSLPVFLPTILTDMGYSRLRSQALAAPPYLIAFGVVLVTSYLSDRHNSRSPYLIGVALLSSASYGLNALAGALHSLIGDKTALVLRYVSVYGAASGFFAAITLIITWTLNNQHGSSARGTGMAILNVVGQCGPLLGTRLYPESQAPYYVLGMTVCAGFMLFVAVLAYGLRWWLLRENRRMEVDAGGMEMEEVGQRLMGNGRKGGSGESTFRYIV